MMRIRTARSTGVKAWAAGENEVSSRGRGEVLGGGRLCSCGLSLVGHCWMETALAVPSVIGLIVGAVRSSQANSGAGFP
jgi:hypothetical protein